MPGLPVHHQLPEFVCLDMMKSFSTLFHQGHERENVPERSHIITTTSAASSGPCRVAMGYS